LRDYQNYDRMNDHFGYDKKVVKNFLIRKLSHLI